MSLFEREEIEERLNEAETKLSMLVQRGNQVAEVDMKTGAVLAESASGPAPEAPSEPSNPPAQQSLIGDPDDDDLPF